MFWRTKSEEDAGIQGTFEILEPEAYEKIIGKENIQLVDVRTPREFKNGHLGSAINIDFFRTGYFRLEMEKLDKTRPVYLYCRSGQRSLKTAKKLLKWGFSEVYDLEGGILNWMKYKQ